MAGGHPHGKRNLSLPQGSTCLQGRLQGACLHLPACVQPRAACTSWEPAAEHRDGEPEQKAATCWFILFQCCYAAGADRDAGVCLHSQAAGSLGLAWGSAGSAQPLMAWLEGAGGAGDPGQDPSERCWCPLAGGADGVVLGRVQVSCSLAGVQWQQGGEHSRNGSSQRSPPQPGLVCAWKRWTRRSA